MGAKDAVPMTIGLAVSGGHCDPWIQSGRKARVFLRMGSLWSGD